MKNGLLYYSGIIRDIKDYKQSEEKLKEANRRLHALSAHLETIVEEERARIAREIHDELGQNLTALSMDIAWLEKKMSRPSKMVAEKIQLMSSLVQSTIHMVQHIATELRPAILDDLGFIAAVEWQAQEFERRTGITCKFSTDYEQVTLDEQRSITFFRILQEALTNVIRHAEAKSVCIQIRGDHNEIIMTVEDNGKGIMEESITRSQSLGILGMQERAFLVGGAVSFTGSPGKGTTVTVQIPYGDGEN